ncbi:MAG TPA: hypothetical protein DDW67_08405 [Elusimicrobia bacterium]|nr:hypothetical protein [Elusimicrobiota bacterium]
MKKPNQGATSRYILLFAAGFSVIVLVTLLFEWANPSKGWLRSINNSWVNLKIKVPRHVGPVLSFDEEMLSNPESFYTYGYGKFINRPADERIVIAAIDTYTVNKLGYPFPRHYYGAMIDKLNKLGAKTIVMDVFTVDPAPTGAASDRVYVDAVKRAKNVSSLIEFTRAPNPNEAHRFVLPIKGLSEASEFMSIPNMDATLGHSDNIIRKVYLFDPDAAYLDVPGLKMKCPETDCGHLGIAGLSAVAYASYNGLKLHQVMEKFGEDPISLNFRHPQVRKAHPGWSRDDSTIFSTYRFVSVKDIIDGRLSEDEKKAIKGGIILVGSTATGAFDHYPSPFFPNMPGVEIHATALDNLLNDDFLRPFDQLLLVLIMMTVIWLPILLRKRPISVIVAAVGGTLLLFLVMDIYLHYKLHEFIFGYVVVGMLLPFVFVTVYKALAEGQEKRWIKNTFGQYLSPKVVDLITKDPSKLSLGGEKRDMTAFFLDLAGFTTMSEKLTPEELTAMLVEYLSAFTDVILKYDGTVDKYIGDCVVAFWNAPLDQADHRKLGVMAAIDCQKELARLNEALTQFEIKPKCRVGVNSGPMVVGNMGSRSRLSYTVMGDSVNMASRMEGANKFFGSKIMTSEYTFEDLKDQFDYRYLGSIRVVGKVIPVKVYEPFALKGEAPPDVKEMLRHYEAGLEKFYKGEYKASVGDFKAALAARPGDGPSQYYIDTAEEYSKNPPKDWDQSFTLTSKG